MNTLSTQYIVGQLIRGNQPGIPQQVQQLTYQLETNLQQTLSDLGYYGILIAGTMAVIALLFGILLPALDDSLTKPVQPHLRPISRKTTYRSSKRVPDTYIARANQAELRLISARIRAGQHSN